MEHELTILESGSRKTTAFVNEDGEVREKSGHFNTEMHVDVTCSCGAEFEGYDEEAIEHLKNPRETFCEPHGETFRKDEECEFCLEEDKKEQPEVNQRTGRNITNPANSDLM